MKLLPYVKCPICEKPAIDGATHPKCQTPYAIDGLTSFFRYDGVIKKAIKKIKYRYITDIVSELINVIPDSSFSIFQKLRTMNQELRTMYLIPVPLHPSRYRNRGFNQAEVIAQALSKRLHIPIKTNVLIRTKNTIPQVDMKDRKKRLANMKDVFAIKKQRISNYELRTMNHECSMILVDDVFTTGATLRSAASVLKHSGVKFVWGITLAQ